MSQQPSAVKRQLTSAHSSPESPLKQKQRTMSQKTLYTLTGDASKPEGRVFSAHVWKTKLDLALLGIDAKPVGKTFPQIRGELSEQTKNPAVTVPTIEFDGQYVTDSWKIAEYLEAEFGTPEKSLFGGSVAGKEFSKFVEIWSNTTLGNELRPFVGAAIFRYLDAPSREYFVNVKSGGDATRHPTLLSKFPVDVSPSSPAPASLGEQLAAARSRLAVIEELLKYKKEKDEPLYLIGGKQPSHADFCLFGWFAFSTIHPAVEKGVWRHPDNPIVEEWLDLLLDSGLVDKNYLQNI